MSITVRNVPDQVRNELASRAAANGWSMQEFLLHELIELSKRPDRAALLARISGETDMPRLSIDLTPVEPLDEASLLAYRRDWLAQSTVVQKLR